MDLKWDRKWRVRVIRAIISGVIGLVLAFGVVSIFFPETHWLTNIGVTLTITGVKALWNIFIFPLYKGFLK